LGFLQNLEMVFYPAFRDRPRVIKILPDHFDNIDELNSLLNKKFRKCMKFFKLEKRSVEEKAKQLTLELTS